jgi:tetratricopeptide (TPR) repeat protein
MSKRFEKTVKTVKSSSQDDTLIDIKDVTDHANDWFEKNKQLLTYGLIALAVVVGSYFAYNYYTGRNQDKAVTQMFQAENQFARDSFAAALNNPGGGNKGFLSIIKEYGSTKAGNNAKLYAGLSYLNLGKFDDAIKMLDDYSAPTDIFSMTKNGALGDAYSEKNNFAEALKYYKKAADVTDNHALTPYYLKKYAMLSDKQKDPASALEAFKTIKSKYPNAPEARDLDKYIVKLEPAK